MEPRFTPNAKMTSAISVRVTSSGEPDHRSSEHTAVNIIMGKRCVVFGCGNTHKQSVSLFYFPKELLYNKAWNTFVSTSRKDWSHNSGHSVVCSAHFETDAFATNEIAESLGFANTTSDICYFSDDM